MGVPYTDEFADLCASSVCGTNLLGVQVEWEAHGVPTVVNTVFVLVGVLLGIILDDEKLFPSGIVLADILDFDRRIVAILFSPNLASLLFSAVVFVRVICERTFIIYNRENDLYKFSKRNVQFSPFFRGSSSSFEISFERLLIGV